MVRPVLVAVIALAVSWVGCEPYEQSARIAAQDFRFTPPVIRLHADTPTRLTIVNEGREPHEMAGPLLTDPRVRILSAQDGFRVPPGRSLTIRLQAQPGAYLFICRLRGHAMSGTLIVEDIRAGSG